MGESCSARVLQCSLLITMQNLEPATQTHVQGEEEVAFGHYFSLSVTGHAPVLPFSYYRGLFCPSSSVWPEIVYGAEHHTASLSNRGWLSCPSRQLALAGQPAVRWRTDVWRGPGGQFLGCDCGSLFCRVCVRLCFPQRCFEATSDTLSDLCSSRSESYWTAVVGDFDITKADPDEQLLKVNRIIPHPKVIFQNIDYTV